MMTEEVKAYFGKQLPIFATADKNGNPNIGPKRTCRIYDDETLIFNENTGGLTKANLLENPNVAVALIDWEKLDGVRITGQVEYYSEGKYFDDCVEYAKNNGMKDPKLAGVIKIKEIFTLKSGPTAGTKIN